MKMKKWPLGLLVLLLIGCSAPAPEPAADAAPENTYPDKQTHSAKTPGYLDQNWDHETRLEWWYTSQGSRVIPYDWFLALERPDSEELIRSNANMERLRFITWPAHSKWNPDGLPIGFVMDKDAESGEAHFGFTCAACHTGLIEYEGKRFLVEGGPAHSDFDLLISEIGESMQKTLHDNDKFSRFGGHVLGDNAESSSVAGLKKKLESKTALLAERIRVNHPPHPNGYGRLDAFGNIFNEGSVFAINEPTNAKPSNAPVSYPVMWDTPQHDILQWNGVAVNAGIGPYTRNTGEVVGVFGDLHIEQVQVAGSPKLRYRHHINVKALERLEEILTTLWSPKWPENALTPIEKEKAQRGKQNYDQLNGIWASAPFLHNGAVPNLWELLQKPDQRVAIFNVGSWEMDPVNVGFVIDGGPASSEFDSSLPGNSNLGHDYGTHLSDDEKWELIEYIKSL